MEGIEISTAQAGTRRDIALLRVKGYIDTQTCTEMLAQITNVLKQGFFHLIVDMGQVNYVSSAGWGVFVGEIKGIREAGGNLKIVEMTPEVHEVFEMLEFNRILEAYDSLEEAIDDFDLSIGLDLTKSVAQSYNAAKLSAGEASVLDPSKTPHKKREAERAQTKSKTGIDKQKSDERHLPLTEKIKKVVIEDPGLNIWKIGQRLNTDRYGNTKVNYWRLYQALRKLNLNSKEKRYRFYRSR